MNAYAYYFTDILVGSPNPQLTSVIVDTGSHLMGFPCGGCDHCGDHLEPAINLNQSKTATWVPCSSQGCDNCHGDRCKYFEKYSEGSAIEGHLFEDYVKLGDAFQENPPVRARMGCHEYENKLFYTQRANGIMGLAPAIKGVSQFNAAPNILDDLFRDKRHVDSRLFSICLAFWGGVLAVGGDNSEYHIGGVSWMPLQSPGYYMLQPAGMKLEDRLVSTNTDDFGEAVVDTGTTLTYFPKMLYANLIASIDSYCLLPDKCKAKRLEGHPHCWQFSGPVSEANFPTIMMRFRMTGEGEEVPWRPAGYLSKRLSNYVMCYAFAPNTQVENTILGISWLLEKDVMFDLKNHKFGVAEARCPEHHKVPTSLWELLQHPPWLSGRFAVHPSLWALAAICIVLFGLRAWRPFTNAYSEVRVADIQDGCLAKDDSAQHTLFSEPI